MVERERISNVVTTTLSVAMDASVATLTPVSYVGFPATGQGRLRLGNTAVPASMETVLVTNWATHPWPVTRGIEGTTAVSHTVAQEVATLLTAGALQSLVGVYDEGTLVGNVSDLDVVGAGATVTLVGTKGTVTIPGAAGTVTSVGLTVPGDLSVSGSPVTGAGTLAVTRAVQNPNKVLAGPTTGADAVPAYRALVADDVPALAESGVTGLVADLAAKAPLASPTFTGLPAAPSLAVSGLTGSVAASRYVGATASGAPTTGAHLLGDFVIDQTGSIWICTVAGTPGTWVQVAAGGGGAVATDAIWDTKGDLAAATGANTATKLAAGANGYVLTADSAEATGLKWAASAGGGGGGAGSLEFADDEVLGAPAASITLTVPAGFRNLVIIGGGRGTTAAVAVGVGLRFNADSGANYDSALHYASQADHNVPAAVVAGTSALCCDLAGASAPANVSNAVEILIPNADETTFYKAFTAHQAVRSDATTGHYVQHYGGVWRSTAAITSITLTPVTGNFDTGTVFTLYGLRDTAPAAALTVATDTLWNAAGDLAVGTGSDTAARLAVGATGERLTVRAGTPAWEATDQWMSYVVDGGGSAITTGLKGFFVVPAGTIVEARLLADQTGSCVVDLWVEDYAAYPPTIADTITASAKPTISSGVKATDTSLVGWTTALADGDAVAVQIDSCSGIQRLTVSLKVRRA